MAQKTTAGALTDSTREYSQIRELINRLQSDLGSHTPPLPQIVEKVCWVG
ncbi:Uncharacterized protein APZ42_002287 [Daphnia magna]|uniref:Uncharacterized protein n=1 Tax=Daphnia magna TaxID=35525 RepID=A0A0N8A4S4_9CRUS|nr:Uncharacterized protein APZ42_002287 [Daphnia magna]